MKKKEKEHKDLPVGDELDVFEEWEAGEAGAEETAPSLKVPEPSSSSKPVPQKKVEEPELDALDLMSDVPVQVVAVLAKREISMKELMGFQMGHVIDLRRPPSEQVDLVANGKLVARGELVDIDGRLGVRIVKLVR